MQGTVAIVFGLLAFPHVLGYQVFWTGSQWLQSPIDPDNIHRHVYDMSEWCPDEPVVLRFGDEIIVQSQRPWEELYKPNVSCSLLIETDHPETVGLLLNVILEDTPTCEDQMIIVPSESSPNYYCGPMKNVTGRVDNFMNEKVTVTWVANGTAHSAAKGVRMLFTAFETVCKPGQTCFPCTNGRVIDEVHMCNGVNNCGDDSDERACKPIIVPIPEISTSAWVWLLLFAVVVLSALLTAAIVLAGKWKSERNTARKNQNKDDRNPLLARQDTQSSASGSQAGQSPAIESVP